MIPAETYKAVPRDLPQVFSRNLESFPLKSKKKQKVVYNFVLKKYLWTGKIQFWQSCRCFPAETLKFFCSRSENRKRNSIRLHKKSFFFNWLIWARTMLFQQTHLSLFSWQSESFPLKTLKDLKVLNFFPQIVPLDAYHSVPTEFPQSIKYTFEFFWPKIQQKLIQNFVLWEVEFSFDNHADQFLAKTENFPLKCRK